MHSRSIIVIEIRLYLARIMYSATWMLNSWRCEEVIQCQQVSRLIMQSIDLGVAWKGQVDSRLLLAEDSISAGVFFLTSFLFLFVLSCHRGWTEPWFFLVFGYHCDQGKWGQRFRIKAHSGLMAITLEISSRSSIGSTDSSHPTKWNSSWVLHLYFIFNFAIYQVNLAVKLISHRYLILLILIKL